jgi:hypothetical protein
VAPFRGFGNRFLSSGGSCGGGVLLLLPLFTFSLGVLVPSEFLFAVSCPPSSSLKVHHLLDLMTTDKTPNTNLVVCGESFAMSF